MADQIPSQQVLFHYIKSNEFRVIHADGAVGGLTPRLWVQMALYSERIPIPQRQVFQVAEDGTVNDPPLEVETKGGIVREVEAEVLMDINTAKALARWLDAQVAKAEQLLVVK